MSIDYALFKIASTHAITPGLAYLLLSADLHSEELEDIDVTRLDDEINAAFPGAFEERENDHSFQCQLSPHGILLETYSSTPDSVLFWFQALAQREGMTFFDPQNDKITKKDQADFTNRTLAAEAEDERFSVTRQLPQLMARAEAGDAHALFLLGNRYSFGEGVPVDKHKAFTCYEASANGGDPDGMFNLAACYRFGDGVPKDISKAIEWYEQATEKDKIFAPYALGEIYMNGEGVPVDKQKAIEYFFLARNNGNQDAGKPLRALGALPPLTTEIKGFQKLK